MPVAAVIPAAIAIGAAAGASIYGGIQKYNQDVEAQRQAKDEAKKAKAYYAKAEANYREEGERFKGQQKTAIASSGVELTGTPLLLMADTAKQIEEGALMIRQEGKDEVERLNDLADHYKSQSAWDLWSGIFGAGTTILTEGSKMYAAQNGNYNFQNQNKIQTSTPALPKKVEPTYYYFGTY